jgi:peptidyl-prolyl cis-trans isomerase C
MNTHRSLLLLSVLGCGLLVSCSQSGVDQSKALVSVNGTPITENDYQDYLRLRQARQAPIPDKDKERQAVLEEMTNSLLLAQSAEHDKLDQDPDVYFQLKRQRETVLARAALRQYLKDHPITDHDVQKRYEQEVAKTNKTEYRARHILVAKEEEARRLIQQLQGGANFAALARANSTDAQSARKGGELGWFNQSEMQADFFNAVAGMKQGDISAQPVKTEFGWHVIQLEETRPLKMPGFDEVKGAVRQLLQQERIEAWLGDLRKAAKIKTY